MTDWTATFKFTADDELAEKLYDFIDQVIETWADQGGSSTLSPTTTPGSQEER